MLLGFQLSQTDFSALMEHITHDYKLDLWTFVDNLLTF